MSWQQIVFGKTIFDVAVTASVIYMSWLSMQTNFPISAIRVFCCVLIAGYLVGNIQIRVQKEHIDLLENKDNS